MLLFKKPFWDGLTSGRITLTFRRWEKPKVKPGGRYRCHPIGVLEVDGLSRVRVADIPDSDLGRAGFADRAALLAYFAEGERAPVTADTEVFRVELHHGGDGDRVPLALEARLSPLEVRAITASLRALDARSPEGRWTARTLRLIEEHPRVAASQLAARIGWPTAPFKANVVKLKKLGLTQSFEVGYELSPRGQAYRQAQPPRPGKPAAKKAAATKKEKPRPQR